MRHATELATKFEGFDANSVPSSRILRHEIPTTKMVLGAILEAAVVWNGYYLLFMTDDIPFEENLRIHFLDENLTVKDSAVIGGPYTTGNFRSLCFDSEDALSFDFLGGSRWHVKLLATPGFRMPFISEPIGVTRQPGFSRHFTVERHQKQEAGQ